MATADDFTTAVNEWDRVARSSESHDAGLAGSTVPGPETGTGINFSALEAVNPEEAWLIFKQQFIEQQTDKESASRFLVSSSEGSGCLRQLLHQVVPCLPCFKPKLPPDLVMEQQTIIWLTSIQLSDDKLVHLQMLKTIFKTLKDQSENVSRRGSHWELIGFQGNDPGTDLRGVGILGLWQLLWLVTYQPGRRFRDRLFALAQDVHQNFPFAVLCINMTRAALQSLKSGCLNVRCLKDRSVITPFNLLYLGCLIAFEEAWRSGNKTVIDAGTVIKEIEASAKTQPKKLLRSAACVENSQMHPDKNQNTVEDNVVTSFSRID